MKHFLLIAFLFCASFVKAQNPYIDSLGNTRGRISCNIIPITIPFLSGSVTVSKISIMPYTISGYNIIGSWSAMYLTNGIWQPIITQTYSLTWDYSKTGLFEIQALFSYIGTMTLDNGLHLNITYIP